MKRKLTSLVVLAVFVCLMLIAAGCTAQSSPAAAASPTPASAASSGQSASVAPSPASTTAPATATAPSSVTGLILTVTGLPKDVTVISNVKNKDGTYREELLYDSMVSIVVERVARVDSTADAVGKQVDKLNAVASTKLKAAKDDAISTKLTYPAWRVTYTTGANEDTRSNLDIYVQTDDWDFRLHTSVPVDSVDEYKDMIGVWIESIKLDDAN